MLLFYIVLTIFKPNAIQLYFTLFADLDRNIPKELHFLCKIDLTVGSQCTLHSEDVEDVDTFLITLTRWEPKILPWENLTISTGVTPVKPSGYASSLISHTYR